MRTKLTVFIVETHNLTVQIMPLSFERIIRLFALSLNVIFNHTLNFTLRMYSKTVSSNSHCIADFQLKMIDSTWRHVLIKVIVHFSVRTL